MFCPNCGNNCGDSNFCFRCGNNLRRDHTIQATDANAPACQYGKFLPTISMYSRACASLELTPNSVIIIKKFPKLTKMVIPYEQIRFVTYMKRSKIQNLGFLSIYTWQCKGPIVTNSYRAFHDGMSFTYNWRDDENTILLMFQFLSECARRNRKKFIKTDVFYDAASVKLENLMERSHQKTCPNCRSQEIVCKEPEYADFIMCATTSNLRISRYLSAKRSKIKERVCMKCGYIWYQ